MAAKASRILLVLSAVISLSRAGEGAAPPSSRSCRTAIFDGEVKAGQSYRKPVGEGLDLYLQPIASGWILRVVAASDPVQDPDRAEVATPPYHSVSPLSISTDFAFRAQDAIGWNPRRFRVAVSTASFLQLQKMYRSIPPNQKMLPPEIERRISGEVAKASQGTFRIVDAHIVAGAADQSPMAAAVASHFSSTAHTLASTSKPPQLGKLLSVRFRVELELTPKFQSNPAATVSAHPCSPMT